ncbi:SMI1/KNR4 family protein [Bhargavaea massiliensis]|uniref:SMI1/KNR4 family protein n=1 Tax=Bhargavaea massiliensis TaxID=2697500 RepID=UPI001BCBBB68|nr:SMI1/KNR4 family protein [Bhargavaea massiliensis]
MYLEEELSNFIKCHAVHTDITGGIPDSRITEIEAALHVKLPDSYRWFLRNYGFGGIFGVDILGAGKQAVPNVVRKTERLRKMVNLKMRSSITAWTPWIL